MSIQKDHFFEISAVITGDIAGKPAIAAERFLYGPFRWQFEGLVLPHKDDRVWLAGRYYTVRHRVYPPNGVFCVILEAGTADPEEIAASLERHGPHVVHQLPDDWERYADNDNEPYC